VILNLHDDPRPMPSFPCPRTLRYCPQHGDQDDVYRLCPTCLRSLIDRRDEYAANPPRPSRSTTP
jgi:hypothetical protein